MFKEYILNELKTSKTSKKLVLEEIPDPCVFLRAYGIKIKKSVPLSKGFEISLFLDPKTLPLDKILKDFTFFVKDNKRYVEYLR